MQNVQFAHLEKAPGGRLMEDTPLTLDTLVWSRFETCKSGHFEQTTALEN